MNLAIRRMSILVFAAFAALLIGLSYVQVVAGPRYRDDDRNTRVALSRVGRERGPIVTADGAVVAASVPRTDDDKVFQRSYPEGARYAHVAGYSSFLFGDSAIEEARGAALTSGRNSTISALLTVLTGGDLRARGLRLTVDDALQQAAIDALAGQAGSVVALDPATGAILAMVSLPDFDPNTLVGTDPVAGEALAADPGRPLLNRALAETYAPGSVFKIVTAAAAIEAGMASPETTYDDPAELPLPGSTATISNFGMGTCGDGRTVTLEIAFARSCNTTFAAIGLEIGAARLVDQAAAFGFNEVIPFDVGVIPSRLPDAASFEGSGAALAQTALGERDVRATPLQVALLGAAVANRGVIMVPYLVEATFDADGQVLTRSQPTQWQRAISPAAADVLVDLMERVVTIGTGRQAAVPGVRVAGKTGTAEVPGGAPHAWFVGFAPIDPEPGQRQIVVAVVVESGGEAGESASGGTVAAPIAGAVIAEWVERPR